MGILISKNDGTAGYIEDGFIALCNLPSVLHSLVKAQDTTLLEQSGLWGVVWMGSMDKLRTLEEIAYVPHVSPSIN